MVLLSGQSNLAGKYLIFILYSISAFHQDVTIETKSLKCIEIIRKFKLTMFFQELKVNKVRKLTNYTFYTHVCICKYFCI
jgi:hypothetical protein